MVIIDFTKSFSSFAAWQQSFDIDGSRKILKVAQKILLHPKNAKISTANRRRSGGGRFFSNIGKLTPEFVTCRKISLRKRGHEIIFCLLSIFFFKARASAQAF